VYPDGTVVGAADATLPTMVIFLVYATGANLTEKYIRHRPGFAEYRSRTSFSVPTLPKSRLP
jgi:steroid 5-alpha reductase family enzyme